MEAEPTYEEFGEVERLKKRNRLLEKIIKERATENAGALALAQAITENVATRPEVKPSEYIPRKHSSKLGGAILDISDVHWAETVSLENTGGLFEYNTDIATKRYDFTIEEAIEIGKFHKIKDITLLFGGDLISGLIHDDLNRTNEMMVAEQTVSFSEVAYGGIEKLLQAFAKVDVVGISGNHGRNYPYKPYYKNKQQENYDWLVMKFLEQYGKNQKGLNITIPDAAWAVIEVAKRRFHALHGDTVKFQKSMGISFYAVEKELRRLKTMVVDGTTPHFHDVISHHLHQMAAIPIGNTMWWNNGALKGPDEFGQMGLRPPEQAQQQMLIVEEGKVRAHYPIVSEHIK